MSPARGIYSPQKPRAGSGCPAVEPSASVSLYIFLFFPCVLLAEVSLKAHKAGFGDECLHVSVGLVGSL